MKKHDAKRDFRMVVVGQKGSGKSAFVTRFLTGCYVADNKCGVDVAYCHPMDINAEHVNLHILDSSGDKLPEAALAWADSVLVMYSIDCRSSYRKAKVILEKVKETNNRNAVVALIGTKSDLWPFRTVLKNEGENLAREFYSQHFEVSAAQDYDDVNRIVSLVTRKILGRKSQQKSGTHTNRTPVLLRKLFHIKT